MADEQQVSSQGMDTARSATVIGPNLNVESTRMVVARDLVVHGMIDGSVVAGGRVVVAEGGSVTGHVQAESVSIAGVVHGGVDARDSLQIDESGELYGEVVTQRIFVAPGSVGSFQLKMRRQSSAAGPSRATLDASRRAYEAALLTASEFSGSVTSPSEGYLSWNEKQSGVKVDDNRNAGGNAGETVAESRSPGSSGAGSLGSQTKDAESESLPRAEISINPKREGGSNDRGHHSAEGAIGRMAWSKSVDDELTGARSDHFGLQQDEFDLLAGDSKVSPGNDSVDPN